MIDSLPTELLECIIDKFDPSNDKSTLLNCALVGRAWVYASQRSIFRTIHLKAPNTEGWFYIYRFVRATDWLADSLNENSTLASYVLYLELEDFEEFEVSDDDVDEMCTSVAEVVNRLSNVRKISMVCVDWNVLSSMLRTALTDMLSAPSVASLAFKSFTISTAADFACLLNHSVNLQALEAVNVEFREISNPTDHPLECINLDALVFGDSESNFLSWFQQQSCPLGIENLRSLKIWLKPSTGYEMAAFLLQQAGLSLMRLELGLRVGLNRRLGPDWGLADSPLGLDTKLKMDMDWLRTKTTLEELLGYVPNLKSIQLVEVSQIGPYTPVPWILSLFKPLLNSDRNRYPLQCITFGLWVDYSVTMEWDSWSAFDVLLENPKFDSLRTVDIVLKIVGSRYDWKKMGREAANAAVENLSGSLPFLKRSGKLKIRLVKRWK